MPLFVAASLLACCSADWRKKRNGPFNVLPMSVLEYLSKWFPVYVIRVIISNYIIGAIIWDHVTTVCSTLWWTFFFFLLAEQVCNLWSAACFESVNVPTTEKCRPSAVLSLCRKMHWLECNTRPLNLCQYRGYQFCLSCLFWLGLSKNVNFFHLERVMDYPDTCMNHSWQSSQNCKRCLI